MVAPQRRKIIKLHADNEISIKSITEDFNISILLLDA